MSRILMLPVAQTFYYLERGQQPFFQGFNRDWRLDYTFIHWAIQWRRRLIVPVDLLTTRVSGGHYLTVPGFRKPISRYGVKAQLIPEVR
jgi:hypothetical protein